MKWITGQNVKVDRVPCPWLIREFVDREAEFSFVPAEKERPRPRVSALFPLMCQTPNWGITGKECSFEAIVKKYNLDNDPAIALIARIVNGADTDNSLHHQPEGPGLNAIAEGFRHLGFKDDHAINAAEWVVYDALYAYCREMIMKGRQHGAFTA